VVDTLAGALDKALDDPEVQKRLESLGGTVPTKAERNPASFETMVSAERERWTPLLKAATAAK
jgi:tripartite-type tricarboxylate transporter receptor subunit TctC